MPDHLQIGNRAGVVLSTYVAPSEATDLRDRAIAGDRSVAAELRRAIRLYLKNDRRGLDTATVKEPAGQGRHDEA